LTAVGLYLELTKAGGKYWRLKYRYGGKEKRLAFGVYPGVSLKDARELATKARQVLKDGGDPGELRRIEKAKAVHESVNTLEAVARRLDGAPGGTLGHRNGRPHPCIPGG
jgi:hypothetical protein